MTRRLGIIGYPIAHSLSPVMFKAALDDYGFNISYEAWEIPASGLPDFLDNVRCSKPAVMGFNVTVPHKEMVMSAMDEVSSEAKRAMAVNTVVNRAGRLYGHNTDGAGFVRALEEEAGFSFNGCSALILGAGGAARGVVMALSSKNLKEIIIANRTPERSARMAKDVKRYWNGSLRSISLASVGLRDAARNAGLIVQCTTMGMLHGPDEDGSLLASEDIPTEALVYDLVYNPTETPLMREAAKAGARVLGGLSMLVYQGAIGFELWTGEKAPVQAMFKATRQALNSSGS